MSYSPINVGAYTSAFAGAIAGMAVSGWITDPNSNDYSNVVTIAGAFAQEFDTLWNNTAQLNELELAAITSVVEQDFAGRGPGPFNNPQFQNPTNWNQAALACAALILECDSFFTSQGINPGTGGVVAAFDKVRYVETSTVVPTANQNGSQTSPYKTYAQANTAISSGSTIYLCPDSYPASTATKSQSLIGLTGANGQDIPSFPSFTINAGVDFTGIDLSISGVTTITATGIGVFIGCALLGGVTGGGFCILQQSSAVGGISGGSGLSSSQSVINGNITLASGALAIFQNTTFNGAVVITFVGSPGTVKMDATSYASWFAQGGSIVNGTITTPGGNYQPGNFWCYQGSGASINVPGTLAADVTGLSSSPVAIQPSTNGYLYKIDANVDTYSTVAGYGNTGGGWTILILGSYDNGSTFPVTLATETYGLSGAGIVRRLYTPGTQGLDHVKVQLQRSTAAATDLVYTPSNAQITVTELAPIL